MTPGYYERELQSYVAGHRGFPAAAVPTVEDALRIAAQGPILDVRKFRRKPVLPRVQRVIEWLASSGPESVIDVGTGRGTALWPIMDALRGLQVSATDIYPGRAHDLLAMRQGGHPQIRSAWACPAEDLREVPSREFTVAMALEVLEHTTEPARALAELLRVARREVILSFPCNGDNNPDHVWLFTTDDYAATPGPHAKAYPLGDLLGDAVRLSGRVLHKVERQHAPVRPQSPVAIHTMLRVTLEG